MTVIVFNLAKVTCRLVQTISVLIIVLFLGLIKQGYIDPCDGCRTFVTTLFLAILLTLLLLRPIDSLGLLLLLLLGSSLLMPSLRFVNSRVFHGVALSTSLSGVGLVIAQTLLVHIFDV